MKNKVLVVAAFSCLVAVASVVILRDGTADSSAPYTEAVANRFNDGEIMNRDEADCVASEVSKSIDWSAKQAAGIAPEALFGDTDLTEQLAPGEIDSLITSIDACHGAGDIVLQIFRAQGSMDEAQLGCFANQMNQESARDLLRLIIAGDQETFVGSEGEVLLGLCSR